MKHIYVGSIILPNVTIGNNVYVKAGIVIRDLKILRHFNRLKMLNKHHKEYNTLKSKA